jgi:hypothetical protein
LDLGGSGIRVVVLESVNGTSLCFGRDQLVFLWLFRASTRFTIALGSELLSHRLAKKIRPRLIRGISRTDLTRVASRPVGSARATQPLKNTRCRENRRSVSPRKPGSRIERHRFPQSESA